MGRLNSALHEDDARYRGVEIQRVGVRRPDPGLNAVQPYAGTELSYHHLRCDCPANSWLPGLRDVIPRYNPRKGGAKQAAEKGPRAVILSSSEGSCSERFQGDARFFVACWLLRMTVSMSFSAASLAPPWSFYISNAHRPDPQPCHGRPTCAVRRHIQVTAGRHRNFPEGDWIGIASECPVFRQLKRHL